MSIIRFIQCCISIWIVGLIFINTSFANNYLSEWYTAESQCNADVQKYNSLYTNTYRSDCFVWENKKYFYNICMSENCSIPYGYGKNISTTPKYKINQKDSLKLDKLVEAIWKKMDSKSGENIQKWHKNFDTKIDILIEKYEWDEKNKALLVALKEKVWESMKSEVIENKMVIYEQEVEQDRIKNLDVTIPIQGLYRATKEKYQDTQTSRYTGIDVCTQEFWIGWLESKQKNADAYIMLYNNYYIETSGYTQYWDGKKFVTTPKDKELHKACIKNTLWVIVEDKYRVTQWKYRWNTLRDWDICKTEFWNEWKVTKNKIAYQETFKYHSKDHTWLTAWQLFNEIWFNECWGFHGNDSWNWAVYTMDDRSPSKNANYCSFNPEKKQDSVRYHHNFVCEIDIEKKDDITSLVQWIYKVTTNKYSYSDSYNKKIDICKVEYGRSWKVDNSQAIDSNIMLFKEYWVTTWLSTEKNDYLAWNWEKEVQQSSNSKNHVTCVEDIYHYYNENYQELLTPATIEEIHAFMKTLEAEIKSKIKETNTHVIFNNKYAITKKKYYGNQIYSTRKCPPEMKHGCWNWVELEWVCPIGYKLDEHTIYYNNYESTIIWYYLNKNKDKFKLHSKDNSNFYIHLWKWGGFDEYFVRKVSLERIKKESQTHNFKTHEFWFANPWSDWKNTEKYNKYHYSNGMWSSEKLGTLLSALCVNKNAVINTPMKRNNIFTYLKWVIPLTDSLYINNSKKEWWATFYGYWKVIARWFFEKSNKHNVIDTQYFLPVTWERWGWLLFIKKYLYK